MIWHLPWYWAVLADVAIWAAWGVAVGAAARRLRKAIERDGWLTRIRPWEQRLWRDVLRVPRWQRRLPEGGAWSGGRDKRGIGGRAGLVGYAAETRRAELVHWADAAALPAFVVWNPPGLLAAMVAYAVVANGPCIASLRYNRLRIGRILNGRPSSGSTPTRRRSL